VYREKKGTLRELDRLEREGEIDLLFTDETAFSMVPSVPYGWQPVGEQRSIRSARDRVANLFGLLSRQGKLKVCSTLHNINSDFIIECVDEVAASIQRATVLVFDNAPWHTAKNVTDKMAEWEEKGLFIFYLPTYSPNLNPIETLWRKMKHEWLKPEHYLSTSALKEAVFHIIRNYGTEFDIDFSDETYV
jgi:transposase